MYRALFFAVVFLGVAYPGHSEEAVTSVEQIARIPLPEGIQTVALEQFVDEPVIAFSQENQEYVFADPFLMQRRKGELPIHSVVKFETTMKPREVFLFFRRYFNTESVKPDAQRVVPYYNSRSVSSFDVINEADVPRGKGESDAVYYRIEGRGSSGGMSVVLNVLLFSLKETGPTTGYLIAWQEEAP